MQDIKVLKEPDLLYAYFGEPFEKFKRPYYVIIDNYMVFSNYPSSLQVFLNSYKNDRQLINDKLYTDATPSWLPSQISFTTSTIKIQQKSRSSNLYPTYFKLYNADNKLGRFDTFIYQLSSDHKRFQTNLLFSKTAAAAIDSTLALPLN